MDRQRSMRHPPTDECKAGAAPQTLGCLWDRWAQQAPEHLRKPAEAGEQPGCIRPIWAYRSGAHAGEQFGDFWEMGAGCAKEPVEVLLRALGAGLQKRLEASVVWAGRDTGFCRARARCCPALEAPGCFTRVQELLWHRHPKVKNPSSCSWR